jgi:hypothetical protein
MRHADPERSLENGSVGAVDDSLGPEGIVRQIAGATRSPGQVKATQPRHEEL